MRIPPQVLLRGLAKLVAVVVGAGIAGALIGIGLAKVSGNDGDGGPVLPATTTQQASTTAPTRTSSPSTSTQTTAESTTTALTSTSTTPAKAVYRVPRVQVQSAQLGEVSQETGRALVAVRVRVTNRGIKPLTIETPVLVSGDDEVPLGAAARDAAQPLLRPLAVGSSATGVLRFTVTAAVAQRLTETPSARLRVARRTVSLKLTTSPSAGAGGTG